MAELPIVTPQGKSSGKQTAADAVFAAPVKPHLVRLAINAHLANRRSGTASTRTRGTIHGGGRKPFRQKGTGRARQGTIRAPHMRGGAVTFGPQPRSYRQHLNRKVRRQALVSALSSLVAAKAIKVIKDFGLSGPKTKEMATLLEQLGLDGGKTLILLATLDPAVALSARNIPYAKVVSTEEINIFDLVTHDAVLATPEAIERIEHLLGAAATEEEVAAS